MENLPLIDKNLREKQKIETRAFILERDLQSPDESIRISNGVSILHHINK
jgi:hypothetical protein